MSLESITGNPIVKTVLLKQLKSAMKSENISLIAITMSDDGEPCIEVYKDPVTVIKNETLLNLLEEPKTNDNE
jgi:hypothetical protein